MRQSTPRPDDSSHSDAAALERERILNGIIRGLWLWGVALAIGASVFGATSDGKFAVSLNPLRGLVVLFCVGAFIGVWKVLLRQRVRKSEEIR